MGYEGLRVYLNQHCRFKLRSGKEVFGVIWKIDSDQEKYVFTTVSDHQAYMRTRDIESIGSKLFVDLNDIVLAEKLVG